MGQMLDEPDVLGRVVRVVSNAIIEPPRSHSEKQCQHPFSALTARHSIVYSQCMPTRATIVYFHRPNGAGG